MVYCFLNHWWAILSMICWILKWQTLWPKVPAAWYVDSAVSWTIGYLSWSLGKQPPIFLVCICLSRDLFLWLYHWSAITECQVFDTPQQLCHGANKTFPAMGVSFYPNWRDSVCLRDTICCFCKKWTLSELDLDCNFVWNIFLIYCP